MYCMNIYVMHALEPIVLAHIGSNIRSAWYYFYGRRSTWQDHPVDSQYKNLVGSSRRIWGVDFELNISSRWFYVKSAPRTSQVSNGLLLQQFRVYLSSYAKNYIRGRIWIETGRAGDWIALEIEMKEFFEIPLVKDFHVEINFLRSP